MARPKKGTKGAEEATLKWRKTMQQKYGGAAGVHKMMSRIGARGGRSGSGPDYKGGFASNPALAKLAGKKGGRMSKRGAKNETWGKLQNMHSELVKWVEEGKPCIQIAKETGVPVSAVYKYIREEIRRSDV